MKKNILWLAMFILLAGCGVTGGPCEYRDVSGMAEVQALKNGEALFRFTYESGVAEQIPSPIIDKLQGYTFLKQFENGDQLSVGDRFPAVASVQTSGSCTPITFELMDEEPELMDGEPQVAIPISAAKEVDPKNCQESGGSLMRICMQGNLACVRTYSDAGKTCNSSSECMGRCQRVFDFVKQGAKTTGQCQRDDNPCGCFQQVENGLARMRMCAD